MPCLANNILCCKNLLCKNGCPTLIDPLKPNVNYYFDRDDQKLSVGCFDSAISVAFYTTSTLRILLVFDIICHSTRHLCAPFALTKGSRYKGSIGINCGLKDAKSAQKGAK